jgi:hypothetical protein
MRFLLALLIAAPLAAQQTVPIPVPDQTIRVEAPPAQVDLTVLVEQLDSTQAAALAAAFAQAAQPGIDLLYQAITEEREQEQQGAGTTERILKTAGWWALGIIALVKLHQIANREPDITNINVTHEDGDIHVTVPPHEHPDRKRKRKDHDDGDSES